MDSSTSKAMITTQADMIGICTSMTSPNILSRAQYTSGMADDNSKELPSKRGDFDHKISKSDVTPYLTLQIET